MVTEEVRFDRLKKLGDAKFSKIKNELMIGTSPVEVARMVQLKWKDCQDVTEASFIQQLKRLRIAMVQGAFGSEVAKQVSSIAIEKTTDGPTRDTLKICTLDTLFEMEELARVQKERVSQFRDREKDMVTPLSGLNIVVNDYSKLLQDIQKVRFDLGADEFKGPVLGIRGASSTATLTPDGSVTLNKQIYEAVGEIEKVFDKRGV
jgi:hypothetical protein